MHGHKLGERGSEKGAADSHGRGMGGHTPLHLGHFACHGTRYHRGRCGLHFRCHRFTSCTATPLRGPKGADKAVSYADFFAEAGASLQSRPT